MVSSGQMEPIYDKPRLYSDVGAELANALTLLPNYHAKCKLVRGSELVEYDIRTLPPPESLPRRGRAMAEHIRQRSRRLYGRPRHRVEEGIRGRLVRLRAREDPSYYDDE